LWRGASFAEYEEATITTATGSVMADIRENARLLVDNPSLADEWWTRCRDLSAAKHRGMPGRRLQRAVRFLPIRFGPTVCPHFDGSFSRENGERSQLTFMVYLNADFTGGETRFYNDDREVRLAVRPEPGMASIFVHLPLHEGAPVVNGRKYVLRTDVMYTSPTQHE
jgi:prolyl 4-hydroxylase